MKIPLGLLLPLVGAILAAGLYLGRLEQRVSELEEEQEYSHGDVRAFMERTAR